MVQVIFFVLTFHFLVIICSFQHVFRLLCSVYHGLHAWTCAMLCPVSVTKMMLIIMMTIWLLVVCDCLVHIPRSVALRPSDEVNPVTGVVLQTRCAGGGRVQSSRGVRNQLNPMAGGSGSPFSYTALPYARPMIVIPPQAVGAVQRQQTGLRGGRVLRSSRNSIPPPSLV